MGGARLKIRLGDEWVPYTQATWVIQDKTGFPKGFAHVERGDLAYSRGDNIAGHCDLDEAAALTRFARVMGKNPVSYALEGHTIALYPRTGPEIQALYDEHLQRDVRPVETAPGI